MESHIPDSTPTVEPAELRALRERIDEVDTQILDLIARRFGFAHGTMVVKRDNGLSLVDTRREAAVVRRAATQARALGLDPDQVREIYWGIIALTRDAQRRSAAAEGGP